ncbi:MAG: NusG domain II-containing protein [Oscillospiraceae bacterium]|nr:NusG domain II-containing protein [Oscillospiraceae bacterium]
MHRFLTKKEFLILLATVMVIAISFAVVGFLMRGDDVVAQVTYDKTVVMIIELSEDEIYHIEGVFPVTLEVKDGAIRFLNSLCPNHDCEAFGYISSPLESAICLPARVSVQIVNRPH